MSRADGWAKQMNVKEFKKAVDKTLRPRGYFHLTDFKHPKKNTYSFKLRENNTDECVIDLIYLTALSKTFNTLDITLSAGSEYTYYDTEEYYIEVVIKLEETK